MEIAELFGPAVERVSFMAEKYNVIPALQRARKYRLKDLKCGGDEKKNTIWDETGEAHF